MKKILFAGLVAVALVAMTGSAVAWHIDVTARVRDAYYSDMAWAMTDEYYLETNTIMDGTGRVRIHGDGDTGDATMTTEIDHRRMDWANGYMYADQYMLVEGCCPDCCPYDDDNCECTPGYEYEAAQGAWVDGAGTIWLGQAVDYPFYNYGFGEVNGQKLDVEGTGDFDAFQFSALTRSDPEYHGWYGGGYGLDYFEAWGIQGMDRDDCQFGGLFEMDGFYYEDPCAECDPCVQKCPPECQQDCPD